MALLPALPFWPCHWKGLSDLDKDCATLMLSQVAIWTALKLSIVQSSRFNCQQCRWEIPMLCQSMGVILSAAGWGMRRSGDREVYEGHAASVPPSMCVEPN